MNSSLSESPTVVDPSAEQDQKAAETRSRLSFSGEPIRDTWLSVAVLCLMFVTMLAFFRFPVKRMFANVEVNYNEGWNAYKAAAVASGNRLYGSPPNGITGAAYPPISFHVIAWLGTTGTFPAVGRVLSLISLILTGILVSLIVRRGGGSRQTAIFSFLLYEVGIAILRPDRIGMDDPQLLGEALSTAGLYFYVRDPNSKPMLCVSALLFCLGGFTKYNLLAFPLAVAIDLVFRSWRSFVTWAGAMVLSAGLLTAATVLVDGRYFFVHLLGVGGRSYSLWAAWSQFQEYFRRFQCLLVIGTAWSVLAFRSHRVLVWAFILSHGLAFLLGGGYGVDLNIFFNGLAATVIICGLALSDVGSALVAARPGAFSASAAMMFGLFAISVLMFVPGQLKRDRKEMRDLPELQKQFQSGADFLRAHPGPAVCESLLLCYQAGKPFEYEPFTVRAQIMSGMIHEADVLQLLKANHFQTVEIALRSDEEDLSDAELRASLASDQKTPEKMRRFSPNFMKELLQDYQLSKRTTQMAIFCPK